MANDLGIKIKVNFPDAGQIQSDFEKKIGKDGLKAKIKLDVDESSLSNLKSKLDSIVGKEKFDLKLNLKTKEAVEALSSFEKQFKTLKEEMQKSFDFKPGKGLTDSKEAMSDVTKNGQLVSKAVGEASKEIARMSEGAERTGGAFDRLSKTQAKSVEYAEKTGAAMNSLKGKVDSVAESEQKTLKSSTEKMAKLREIAKVMKEINSLETKGIGTDSGTKNAIEGRVKSLKDMLNTLQQDYKKTFNEDYADTSMIKNIKSVGEYNKELKKVALEKQNQKQIESEHADRFKDLLQMENKRYQLLKKSESAGEQESHKLKSQAAEIEKQSKFYEKQHNIIKQANVGQVRKLNMLAQESQMISQISAAKKTDKGVDKSYKELKADLKQIYSLHNQINNLTERKKSGVLTSKEEGSLKTLRSELKVREQLYNVSKRKALDEGKMTSSSEKGLKNAEREYQARNKIAQSISKSNAQVAKSDNLYSQAASKIQRISKLTDKLSGASKNESIAIKRVVASEEAKVQAIMDSIKAQGLLNEAAEKEISIRRKSNNEERKNSEIINEGKQLDNDLSQITMGQLFNPRQVASTAKMAFQEIYESVRTVDEKLIDIAKVADVPTSVLDKFGSDVYDFASKFGVSADGYAEAVGRWVTTGRTLSESIDLANASVMGSFVGNIGEEEMVNYMAVPLNAWKSEMLEANDVINAMNEVSNNNAVEMKDLGAAYERAGATAAQAGTSFAELTGMITGAQEATHVGGEKIGTAMKAIDVNFGKISSKIEKGDIKKFDFFDKIGVSINDGNGELRSTYDILTDLSGVWKDLSATDKSTAGMYAAGKNHSSIFSGMLENWQTVIKAANEAKEQVDLIDKEAGSAFIEFGTQQESVAYKANNLQNTWAKFLSTISGGKDGVNQVLAKVSDVLEIGTKVAENPLMRKLGKSALGVTAIMTATTAVSSFFKIISAGSIASMASLKGVGRSFTRAGRAAKAAAKADVASQVASKASVAGGTVGIGMAAGAGAATSAFSKLIPVIGNVISILAILESFGVPVWSTMGKMINKVVSNTDKAKKSLNEYKKVQQETNKELQENKILNGTYENFNTGVKNYKELRNSKEQEYKETGEKSALSYSKDEFLTIKKQFNGMAEALGFDLKITWNNFDHIEDQFNKLIKLKGALNSEEASKLGEGLKKKSKYQDTDGLIENHEKIKKANNISRGTANNILGNPQSSKEQIAYAKEMLSIVKQFDEYNGNLFNSGEMKKAEKENDKRIKDLIKTRDKLSKAAQAGTLQEGFGDMGEEARQNSLALLSSEIPLLNKKNTAIEQIQQKIKANGSLTQKEQALLVSLNKDYATLANETSGWDKIEQGKREQVLGYLESLRNSNSQSSQEIENSIRQLGQMTEMSGQKIEEMIAASKEGGMEFVNLMSQFGDMGASILGVTPQIMAAYESDWPEAIQKLQAQLEKIPEEKVTEYSLVQENGVANFKVLDEVMNLPDTIIKEFELMDKSKNIQVENTVGLLDKLNSMPSEIIKELGIDIGKNGRVDLQEVTDAWNKLSSEQERKEFMALFTANNEELNKKVEESKNKTKEIDESKGTATHDADNSNANSKVEETKNKTKELDNTKGTVTATGEVSDAETKLDSVYAKAKKGASGEVRITGWVDSVVQWFRNLGNGSTKTVSVNVKGNKSSSAAIKPNIGKSMSMSVGEALTGGSKDKAAKSGGNSRAGKDQTVDENVWRYWAKELFKGTPLERSMDNLNNSIKQAGDSQDKLISLYKQQITLLDKQIAYNNDMRNAKQQELYTVMAKLRNDGFKTSGNQVTNLNHSKSFKGEKASDVNEQLRKYRDLYQSIDQLNGTINSLNISKFDANENIKKAEIEKELKSIEKSLKRQEALLVTLRNRTDLLNTKDSFISEADVELKLVVAEEIANNSVKNIKDLTDEFNKLSLAQIKHSENAEQVKGKLENLKSEILSNADAIISYKEAISNMRIGRFINDYQKFGEILSGNIEKLNSNIEHLKSGLVDGSEYGELVSSSLENVVFDRKSKLEKEHEERLKLEDQLNKSLEGYAQKNIDRSTNVANSVLKIEKDKYAELLEMASKYSDGKLHSFNTLGSQGDFGLTSVPNSSDKTANDKWLNSLKNVNAAYQNELSIMQKAYEQAMSTAKTKGQKDLAANRFIIDQLTLQEKVYRDIVDINKEAVKIAEKELENTTLTTDQRETLNNSIKDYKENSIAAQKSIKESIEARYNFEFEMLDKAKDKAASYSESLDKLLDIANAVNSSSQSKKGLLDNIYESKLGQYANAKDELSKLIKEQAKFTDGSYEWKLLDERISSVTDNMHNLTTDLLEANKAVLDNSLEMYKEQSENRLLNGQTLDQFKDQKDKWLSGISKELELEKLRITAAELENSQINKKLEILDRQEKISKKDTEYLEKQMKVIELQNKLKNLDKERTVQTIARKDDGTWNWQYVVDQSDYDKTKSELNQSEKDLEDFKENQRESYVSDLNSIIENAKGGKFKDSAELSLALQGLKDVYGSVLEDIPDVEMNNIDEIVKVYDDYLIKNKDIVSKLTDGTENADFNKQLELVADRFERSFKDIATDVGKIIGDEIKEALRLANTTIEGTGRSYVIEKQELNFPNAKDRNDIEQIFKDLPSVVDQAVKSK